MKLKLLRQVLVMSKYSLIGLFVQCLLFNVMWAKDGLAQTKSIDEVYLSIKLDNVQLIDALKEIESRTEFNFAYDKSLLNEQTRVSLSARNKSLGFILKKISKEARLDFRRVDQQIYVKSNNAKGFLIDKSGQEDIYFQGFTVTGKVKSSDDNEFLPGVNVVIKGTSKGTVTDVGGAYKIVVPDEEAVLVFSSVGYVQEEVAVSGRAVINVDMEPDIKSLQEVVVVGYGEMKKTDLSTAQTSINSDAIQKTVNTTIEQAIQGRAAGVYITQNTGQPGGGISVNIRGINSISGSNEPLYVIDGVQMQQSTVVDYGAASSSNPLAGLNPADIENIEILQGPSATAIYGSRGTNGVVLITTKRGKSGKTKISYDYLYSLQDKPKILPLMDLPQYAQMYTEIREINGGEGPEEFSNPSLLGPGTNWQEELFKTALLQKHQLSLSGGTEKTTYYLSGEYFNQEGIAIGSGFKRYNVRLNLDNQVRDWLKISANLNFNQTNEALSTTQENVINNALSIAPNIPVKNPDGTWGGADESNNSSVQFTPLNPVAIANLVENNLVRKGFLGGINATIDITKGLQFRTSLNTNIGFHRQDYFVPSYRLGDKINDVASLDVYSGNDIYWNWNQLLQYNKSFGDHNLEVMVSHEAQESSWENLSGGRDGFVSNEIPDINIGDSKTATNGGGQGDWAMESFFGRINYNFNEKYIVQAAYRADGSANFGPDNRWGHFPSASAAWRISEEPFMNSVTFINELKLRVEAGITGNQGNGARQFSPLASVSTPWGTGFPAQRYGNENLKWEETLTKNVGINVSLFDNRIQFEGDLYVKNTDNLLLENPLPDYMGTSGEGSIGTPTVNIGKLENRGWSFALNTYNIDNGTFSWKSNFNMSGFKTKITKFYSETAFVERRPWFVGDTGSGNNWAQRAELGKEPWLFQGYLYEGLFQSVDEINNSAVPVDNNGERLATDPSAIWVGDVKFKDLNGDGIIDERDKTDIGNPWPKFNFGFTNTFSYKGFQLDILLTGVYGNDVYNLLRFNNTNPNNINLGRNLLLEAFNYAKVEGDGNDAHLTNPETGIPRITGSDINGNRLRFTDQYVEDGSYIRIKNVQLTYSLPMQLLGKQNVVQGVRLSAGAQNLYTFTNYKGYDPEVGAYVGRDAASDNISIGLDYGRYPLTPVYTFSVGLDF